MILRHFWQRVAYKTVSSLLKSWFHFSKCSGSKFNTYSHLRYNLIDSNSFSPTKSHKTYKFRIKSPNKSHFHFIFYVKNLSTQLTRGRQYFFCNFILTKGFKMYHRHKFVIERCRSPVNPKSIDSIGNERIFWDKNRIFSSTWFELSNIKLGFVY